MKEYVNHPEHYNQMGRKECIVEMEDNFGAKITAIFCLTNCYKYLYRKDAKGEPEQDKSKAVWYYNYFRTLEPKIGVSFDIGVLLDAVEKEMLKSEYQVD